jgi:hypothetical protein
MRRKLTEREIETLNNVFIKFLVLSSSISLIISICSFPIKDIVPFTRDIPLIAFIWFLITFICLYILASVNFCCLKFLRNRNDKIDEEEKAQLQAKAQAEADKEKAEVQIWVI